jgi:hypothetical protein
MSSPTHHSLIPDKLSRYALRTHLPPRPYKIPYSLPKSHNTHVYTHTPAAVNTPKPCKPLNTIRSTTSSLTHSRTTQREQRVNKHTSVMIQLQRTSLEPRSNSVTSNQQPAPYISQASPPKIPWRKAMHIPKNFLCSRTLASHMILVSIEWDRTGQAGQDRTARTETENYYPHWIQKEYGERKKNLKSCFFRVR